MQVNRPLDPARDRWLLGTLDSIVAAGDETDGAYSVLLRLAPRGFSPPHHVHASEDTGFLVLDGQLTVRVGDEETILGPNEFRFAPRDMRHWFRVESETARFLEILSPPGFEAFHHELSSPATRFDIPPADHPLPSAEELARVARRHGATILPGPEA